MQISNALEQQTDSQHLNLELPTTAPIFMINKACKIKKRNCIALSAKCSPYEPYSRQSVSHTYSTIAAHCVRFEIVILVLFPKKNVDDPLSLH